jgi:2-amino-4-hydroxy-6-hydroxymethyldihydropteridine diphosphokinase
VSGEAARAGVMAFLGLGSNLGDRAAMLLAAAGLLAGDEIRITRKSRVYESPAWGKTDQPPFFNQVVEVETILAPEGLLARCQHVEDTLGRVRRERWGPRTIDIDILLYDDLVIQTPDLVVPHTDLWRRAFVLVPLAEVAPALRLPTGETVENLLRVLPDRAAVRVATGVGVG